MYALVFWIESKKWSIEPAKLLPIGSKKGDEAKMKHNEKYYNVRVLQLSEDKKFLESLEISTEGEIMPARTKKQRKDELEAKKIKKAKKTKEKARRDTLDELDQQLLKYNSSEDVHSSCSGASKKLSVEQIPSTSGVSSRKLELPRKQLTVEIEKFVYDRNESRSTSREPSPALSLPKKSTPMSSRSASPAPDEPTVEPKPGEPTYPDCIAFAEEWRETAKNLTSTQQAELQPGSGVYVDKQELQEIASCRRTPPKMVRLLLLYLVGPEKLRNMTAKGALTKPGAATNKAKKGISPKIFEAVKYYVDKTGLFKLSNRDYVRVINQQSSNLRCSYARKQAAAQKLSRDQDSSDDS